MNLVYEWRGEVDNAALEALHGESFGHDPIDHDWESKLRAHSLGWVCAHQGARLIGFVNVAWDGGEHAFILDTLVTGDFRHQGVGSRLVEIAAANARTAGCEWLHADYEPRLRAFYEDACGFLPTPAGLIEM